MCAAKPLVTRIAIRHAQRRNTQSTAEAMRTAALAAVAALLVMACCVAAAAAEDGHCPLNHLEPAMFPDQPAQVSGSAPPFPEAPAGPGAATAPSPRGPAPAQAMRKKALTNSGIG